MDPQLLIALAQLASSIYTNRTNQQIAQQQAEWNVQQQDKQNEYNLPVNQLQRLRDAGMSPTALKMGQGFDVAGNTSAPVNTYQVPMMLDPMQMASNSMLAFAQAQKAKEEAKTEKDTRQVKIDQIKLSMDKFKEEISMLQLDQRAQEIANSWADLQYEVSTMKDLSQIGLNEKNAQYLSSLTDKNVFELKNVLPKEVQLLVDKHELNLLDQKAVIAAIKKTYVEIENIESDTALNKDQLTTNAVERGQTKQQMEYVSKQIQLFEDTYEDVVSKISNESKLTNRQVKAFWINMVLHGAQVGSTEAAGIGLLLKGITSGL